jgi:hypothetical protein
MTDPASMSTALAVIRAVPTRDQAIRAVCLTISEEGALKTPCAKACLLCAEAADAVLALFKDAMESAVPGSESQHDDEAGLNAR